MPPAKPTINIPAISPKQSVSVSWTLQVPAILQAGTYQLGAVGTFQQGGAQQQTTAGTTGSSSTFTLSVGNFWYPLGSGGNSTTTQVASVNYTNYPSGSSGHTVYVFSVSVSIDSSKTVKAVMLPKITGSVAGYVAAMHIFAIGIK